jgi:hypothetical protein
MNAPPIGQPCPDSVRRFLREAALVFLGNTVFALFMAAVKIESFWPDFIYSQCIGFSIFIVIRSLCMLRRRTRPGLAETAAGIPLGGFVGFVLGTWGNGLSLAEVVERYPHAMVISAAGAVFFGSIATYYFHAHARLIEAEAEARNEKLRRMEQESHAARAELRVLQAQIEPHFLFNTLSNVVGLIEQDPSAARAMLLDLTALLRASLARTRREGAFEEAALSEELDLLRAYLGIMGRRMGERLVWRIEAEPETLALHLPPLLLQPLVENAIHHGLEPKPEGGELVIACRRLDNRVEITVSDSGAGLDGAHAGGGVGLANVRARLLARYGAAATLELAENPGGGVTARLSIPLENHAPADR